MVNIDAFSVTQIAPFSANSARVQGQFHFSGGADFVQVYAILGIDAKPGAFGDAVKSVDVNAAQSDYSFTLDLFAGEIYTIWACPRTNKESPDDMIDGAYWEAFCVWQTIVTQAVAPPPTGRVPPVITALEVTRATLTQPEKILLRWQSSQPYGKFQITWTKNGVQQDQAEVSGSPTTTGSWTAEPISPGAVYTFAVNGGVSSGISGNFLFSPWSTTIRVVAPQNRLSLRDYLQASGVVLTGVSLRALMRGETSLRAFMKLA